ncbi:MAG: SufD family Fe-S cluster assembly protein, partial [Gammaproteobacteria bacterium]
MSEPAVTNYLEEYDRRASAATPEWLAAHRRAGMDAFCATGFPTLRHEDWKYTDIRPIARHRFRAAVPSMNGMSSGRVGALRLGDPDPHEMVFVHGHHAAALYRAGALPQGLDIRPLGAAIADSDSLPQQHLAPGADIAGNPFVALNSAFMNDGACVSVADDAIIETPIHLMFLSGSAGESVVSFPRNLFVLGRNAKATVIEHYWGTDESSYFTDTVTDVILGPGARLEHYKLQQEGSQAFHIGALRIFQDRLSRLESHSISLGGALARNDIHARLAADG